MKPVVVLLVGLPGTGKYTAAKALVSHLRDGGREVRLVDNHYVANPILHLVAQDGASPLPQAVWVRVAEVREAVLKTAEALSPLDWSFVFTADLGERPDDAAFVQRLAAIAERRAGRLVVIRLLCDLPELRRRITAPARRERLKSISEADAVERHAEGVPALAQWSPCTIDVTALSESEATARVISHVADVQNG